MGCRSSTAAAEPSEAPLSGLAPVPTAAKRTVDDLPPDAVNAVKSDGSETSTDDSSSSLQMSSTLSGSNGSKDAMDLNEGLSGSEKDPEKVSEILGAGAIDVDLTNLDLDQFIDVSNDVFLEPVPEDHQVRQRVSCMLGTTPRDPSRRVSFNEGGPDVVHIEALELNCGMLRRASPVNVGGFEPLDDPSFEAVLHMRAAHEVEANADFVAALAAQRPLPPRTFGSKWALCCVAPGDGDRSPPLHNECEYNIHEDGDSNTMPYASQLFSQREFEEEKEDVPFERISALSDASKVRTL